MTPELVFRSFARQLMAAFWLAAPLLAIGFIAGIVISLGRSPPPCRTPPSARSAAGALPGRLLFLLPWMLHRTMGYTVSLLGT